MKCPICDDVRLREVEKAGVLIDVCPECKGVWLDRGELEKLMSDVRETRKEFNQWQQEYDNRSYDNRPYENRSSDNRPYDSKYPSPYYKKKKKGILDRLEDLFD